MSSCRPCRIKTHDRCKRLGYRKRGCSCRKCHPDLYKELRRLRQNHTPRQRIVVPVAA